MRSIIYLIIIGAAGYLGYNYYLEKIGGKSDEADTPPAATAEADAPHSAAPAASLPQVKVAPVFKSKIVIPDGAPGEKHLAKPGVYYVLERASITHENGIAAVVPGEEVKLLMRKNNGTVKVTNGRNEFEMKESQITNDLDLAREVERKYTLTHPPSPSR